MDKVGGGKSRGRTKRQHSELEAAGPPIESGRQMSDGAKKHLARMQGRKISECACGDDAATECRTCGEPLCRDCKLDHDCQKEDAKPKGSQKEEKP